MTQLLVFNSPAIVTEGESYSIRIGVTNQSFRAGVPIEAILTIVISVSLNGPILYDTWAEPFAAGETKSFESRLAIPLGYGGIRGSIAAYVYDPEGRTIGSDAEVLEVVSALITGSLSELPMLIWHEPMTYWETLTPIKELPLDTEIHLAPQWVNTSAIPITGHVDLTIIYPDNTERVLSAVENQDKEASGGSGWTVQFEPFLTSQTGTYRAIATLSGSGVLDTTETELVVSQVYASGEFTVRLINYDELMRVSAETGVEAQWFAQIPSRIRFPFPARYLYPTDGQAWRDPSQDCKFLIPDYSEFWLTGTPPTVEIIIGAGPACEGWGWTDHTCRSYGTVAWSGVISIIPGCVVIYDYSTGTFTIQ